MALRRIILVHQSGMTLIEFKKLKTYSIDIIVYLFLTATNEFCEYLIVIK